jgi:hypothetical protein
VLAQQALDLGTRTQTLVCDMQVEPLRCHGFIGVSLHRQRLEGGQPVPDAADGVARPLARQIDAQLAGATDSRPGLLAV